MREKKLSSATHRHRTRTSPACGRFLQRRSQRVLICVLYVPIDHLFSFPSESTGRTRTAASAMTNTASLEI
jgi:hypothetical protein